MSVYRWCEVSVQAPGHFVDWRVKDFVAVLLCLQRLVRLVLWPRGNTFMVLRQYTPCVHIAERSLLFPRGGWCCTSVALCGSSCNLFECIVCASLARWHTLSGHVYMRNQWEGDIWQEQSWWIKRPLVGPVLVWFASLVSLVSACRAKRPLQRSLDAGPRRLPLPAQHTSAKHGGIFKPHWSHPNHAQQ